MKIRLVNTVVLALLCTLVLAWFAPPVNAQQKNYYGLIISPPLSEFKDPVVPGTSVTGSFTITNDYAAEETVNLEYRILDVAQKDTIPVFLDGQDEILRNQYAPLSMKSWITIEPKTFTLGFAQATTVKYTITVPANATPGGRYASIFFQRAGSDEAAGASIGQNLGHLIFLKVKGDIVDRSKLISFTSDRSWYDFLPAHLNVSVVNTGNVHTNIGGNIFIYKNDITKPIHTLTVNPTNGFILPLNERSFDHVWGGGWITWETDSSHKRHLKVDWGQLTKIYFGEYHAQLKLRHTVDGERVTTTKEISFWVFPWQLIVPLVVILLVLVWWVFLRRKKPKQVHPHQQYAQPQVPQSYQHLYVPQTAQPQPQAQPTAPLGPYQPTQT